MPDLVTHNYDPRRGPFRNVCGAGRDVAQRVLGEIAAEGVRTIKTNYLERRIKTEAWLLASCTAKLGTPRLANPIYFFLGDFADGTDPSRPRSIQLPLSLFERNMMTFTYSDSMASLPLARRHDHAAERRPYHGEVFTFDEIRHVVAAYGLPGDHWRSDPARRFDRFIEVQVWDDRPFQHCISALQASRSAQASPTEARQTR